MINESECVEDEDGTIWWYLDGENHREDGPAREYEDGYKEWWLHDEEVEPEDVVDYNLAKGIFCYYNEQTQQLIFEGDN